MKREEAQRHLEAIVEKLATMKKLRREIKAHQHRLKKFVADIYNERSEEELDDGITIEVGEIILGEGHCTESPIEAHVLGRDVMSLPGRKLYERNDKSTDHNDPSLRTDACLFCGKIVDSADDDPV